MAGSRFSVLRTITLSLLLTGVSDGVSAQEATPASTRLVGTVTALSGTLLTLTPDKGEPIQLTLSAATKVIDLPPGSMDLKTAVPGNLQEIEVGDRVLVTSILGSGSTPAAARRVVMMKSVAIAQQRASEQAGWAHSHGGTVETVDAASGAITMSSRGKRLTIMTTPSTIYRRYAVDSARFEDSKRSTITEIHVGDQARVRGEAAGETVQAAEIVSGTFEQISGSVIAMDPAASTVTVRDLKTKKSEVVKLTPKTELHQLPAEMAAQFAERSKAGGKGAPQQANAGSPRPQDKADLGQAVAYLPNLALAELKVGQAVLLIATGDPAAPTAMTVLSGVEPLLAAMENGGAETALAPWSMSGGDSSGGGNQ